MMATLRRTIEQDRARLAWSDIETVPGDQEKKYGTLARKLPAMIQMNGLGSTLAFLLAKGKGKTTDGHMIIYKHISTRVLSHLEENENHTELIDLVRKADTGSYRRATAEAIEYGIWLKRYVEAKDWGSAEGDTDQ